MNIDGFLRLFGLKRLKRHKARQVRQIRDRIPRGYRRVPPHKIPRWMHAKASEYLKQDKKRSDDVFYTNEY